MQAGSCEGLGKVTAAQPRGARRGGGGGYTGGEMQGQGDARGWGASGCTSAVGIRPELERREEIRPCNFANFFIFLVTSNL